MKEFINTQFKYKEIPQTELDQGYNGMVHVKGWPSGCRFFHIETVKGEHTVKTSKGKIYKTASALLYTKKNTPR